MSTALRLSDLLLFRSAEIDETGYRVAEDFAPCRMRNGACRWQAPFTVKA
jgi:hypothetical protein